MSFDEHCDECLRILGQPFEDVHKYLDAFAGSSEYGMRHRRKRHHLVGIEEVRRLFGAEAAEAARLHIVSDLKEEGWTESDPFPKDEKDYVRMGLF